MCSGEYKTTSQAPRGPVDGEQSGQRHKWRAAGGEGREVIRIQINVVVIRDVARSGIERAPIGGHLGTILPFGCDYYPLLEQSMPTKLVHDYWMAL